MRSSAMPATKWMLGAALVLGLTAALLLTLGAPGPLLGPPASVAAAAAPASTAPKASTPSLAASASTLAKAARAAKAARRSTTAATTSAARQKSTAPAVPGAATASTANGTSTKPVFVIYYLWWTAQHWQDRLGAGYGSTAGTLPATLDASGCGAHSTSAGNKLTDVPGPGGYDQSSAATIERDVRLAASTGITGFAVNWNGAGTAGQSVGSTAGNRELQYVFDAVHKINAEGIPFRLMLNYKASARKLSTATINGDMSYFTSRYGADPALDHTYANRAEMIWAGSWKYTSGELSTVSASFRGKLFLIGDEKPSTWNAARAAQLDGASYYWSSQDPWGNPASFGQLRTLADAVHAGTNPDGRAKTWLAPFTPGYNAQLLYGTSTCVPRRDGQTMHQLFGGNKASNPDGWTFISWNEIAEGSYIVPLTRYGQKYTNELKSVIANNG